GRRRRRTRGRPTPRARPEESPVPHRATDRVGSIARGTAVGGSSSRGREAPMLSGVRWRIVQRAIEDGTRLGPVAPNGARGDAKGFGRLFLRHTTEEAAFDDSRETLIDFGEVVQRLVELEQRLGIVRAVDESVVERDRALRSAALFRGATTRAIDEDVPHG